jgi:hypothetical protein
MTHLAVCYCGSLRCVAAHTQIYLGANDASSACYGITTELFVPAAPSVDSRLAPLQEPYVVQSIIEKSIQAKLAQLPVYVSAKCQAAARKLACGVALMAPELQADAAVQKYLGKELHMPRFPHRSVCTAYNAACLEFITVANLSTGVNLSQVHQCVNLSI